MMIICASIIALGLLLSGLGIILTFIAKPPMEELKKLLLTEIERAKEMMAGAIERSNLSPGQARAVAEEQIQSEIKKLRFSFFGISLLLTGAVAQLAGTIGQVIILLSKK